MSVEFERTLRAGLGAGLDGEPAYLSEVATLIADLDVWLNRQACVSPEHDLVVSVEFRYHQAEVT